MAGAKQTIIINATPEKIFSVITNYGNYANLFDDVVSCTEESREGNVVVSTFQVDLKIKVIGYTIRLIENPSTNLSWTLIRGDYMEVNSGSWTLTDLGDGRTKVLYTIEIVPKVPRTLKFMKKTFSTVLADQSLPATLMAVKTKAESL